MYVCRALVWTNKIPLIMGKHMLPSLCPAMQKENMKHSIKQLWGGDPVLSSPPFLHFYLTFPSLLHYLLSIFPNITIIIITIILSRRATTSEMELIMLLSSEDRRQFVRKEEAQRERIPVECRQIRFPHSIDLCQAEWRLLSFFWRRKWGGEREKLPAALLV
jgi:hypothetical protein